MRTLTVDEADLAWDGDPPVLSGVSLTARPGEVLAVTGTSGAGKTTLLSAMAGLLHPVTGRVLVDDEPPADRDQAVKLGVMLIPQDNGLAAILTVAVVFATHDPEAAAACDRELHLSDGEATWVRP